jgi:hypothetical protein
MAKDWTPAQMLTRLAAMISPSRAPTQTQMMESGAATTNFGKRPSPREAAASQRTKSQPKRK